LSRPKEKDTAERPLLDPTLRAKVYMRDDMVGAGKVTLLRLLGETGSIAAAAREMGIGYRRAWFLLESLQACFAQPLFTTARGGKGKGGAQLTETGSALIAQYGEFEARLETASRPFLDWLTTQQAAPKTP